MGSRLFWSVFQLHPLLLTAIESFGEAFEQRSLWLHERSLFCLVGGVNHVLRADALRVGHGCHFSHSDLPVGGGGLCRGPLLQRSEADHEEGAV